MVIQLDELRQVRAKTSGKIVLTLGAFDIIHPGHISYLEWAKLQGDILVVSLKDDEQIKSHKGSSRPVISAHDRMRVVESLKPVDYALIGAPGGLFEAAVATARILQPDIVVLGPDWGRPVLADWQAKFPHMTILVAPPSTKHSTSAIIERIQRSQAG